MARKHRALPAVAKGAGNGVEGSSDAPTRSAPAVGAPLAHPSYLLIMATKKRKKRTTICSKIRPSPFDIIIINRKPPKYDAQVSSAQLKEFLNDI